MNTITNEKKAAKLLDARGIAQIGILSAIAAVLMVIEIPLWFAPSFYKIDLSELPVLIGGFAMGPFAGVVIELVKVLLYLLIHGSSTGGVGDIANFIIGCSFVIPSTLIYRYHKSKKSALIGMAVGTLTLIAAGSLLNAFVLLPFYANVFHMPLDALVAMGHTVNPSINDLPTFVMLAVAPFNLLKGLLVSAVTMLVYKHVSPILHNKMGRR
ncbi:ECF transporter S component [Caproiciproducens sp.]|uniref:ECF transporter S component n=1 Tax=Caproiciproducens sp. TaxID=1954376 RepID=UPI0028990847|nr:ECF transporter S component [Caproiciproducens sp.]